MSYVRPDVVRWPADQTGVTVVPLGQAPIAWAMHDWRYTWSWLIPVIWVFNPSDICRDYYCLADTSIVDEYKNDYRNSPYKGTFNSLLATPGSSPPEEYRHVNVCVSVVKVAAAAHAAAAFVAARVLTALGVAAVAGIFSL